MSKAKKRMTKSRSRIASQQQLRHDPQSAPPPELVDAYVEVQQWAAEHPREATELRELDEDVIASLVSAIAFPDQFGLSDTACDNAAIMIKRWAVLTGVVYLYEWREPLGTLSPQQIIAKIRADRDAGLIAKPHT